MGPLMPLGIISQEIWLISIFLVGIAFGMILEQSGLSSPRKLVGVFYAYDFVVLKVFFTAGITAMTGLFFMRYFGWLDTDLIFIHSNHLYPAIIGGVIMGFGFLIGGFCPGTGITSAAIGKTDAMLFIAGMFAGVFLYGLFADQFNMFRGAVFLDRKLITELTSIPQNLFIALMILMALVAFKVATHFEKKAPHALQPTHKGYKGYTPELIIAVAIAATILVIPETNPKRLRENSEKVLLSEMAKENFFVTTEELAYHMVKAPLNFMIIDVRSKDEFRAFHLPNAVNIPLDQFTNRQYRHVLRYHPGKRLLLVSNGGVDAVKAWQICRRLNISDVYVLEGGLNAFVFNLFYDNDKEVEEADYLRTSKYRFRQEAAQHFRRLQQQ